uniref:Bulb-type lectin domain-containing protein n=1 Tax=Oryza punctata TaxID=4537 RepID=A0A0E0MJ97_ORYPU
MTSSLATFVLLVIITLSSSSRPCPRRVDAAREWLARGASIAVEDHASDVLHSPDGTFAAGFYDASPTVFTFSVWFARAADRAVVWTAARARPPSLLLRGIYKLKVMSTASVAHLQQRTRLKLLCQSGLMLQKNVAIRYTQGLTVEVTVFPCVRILVKQLPCLAAVPFPASFLLHTTVSGGYRSGQTPTQAS